MNLERSISNLARRLNLLEGTIETETDEEIEARFAKLREARAKKTNAFGEKTYEDVWDNISQEELDYYKRKSLEIPQKKDIKTRKNTGIFMNQAGI